MYINNQNTSNESRFWLNAINVQRRDYLHLSSGQQEFFSEELAFKQGHGKQIGKSKWRGKHGHHMEVGHYSKHW